MTKQRILVVDDEESLCEILKFNLEKDGYEVDVAYSAEEALELPLADYQLILLDVMMGGMSGFDMAKQVKAKPELSHLPIVFCTAKDTEDDIVTGLNLGAEDYIAKPYKLREVSARIRTILRRISHTPSTSTSTTEDEQGALAYNGLVLNRDRKICTLDGEQVSLTKKEFEILSLFLSRKNYIFSRDEILKYIWKDEVVVLDRTIDVNITRLRKKISHYGAHIVTRNGYGYGFEI